MRKPSNNWGQILLIAVVLIGAIGLLYSLTKANDSATAVGTAAVAHDHDGDGKPDENDTH